MKIGIIGYAGSGKTSFSTLLSGKKVETFDPHHPAVVAAKIIDLRLQGLVEKVQTEKTTPPETTLLDFKAAPREAGFDEKVLSIFGEVDFIIMVVDGFSGDARPASDLSSLQLEFIYHDEERIAVLEKKREAEVRHGHRKPNLMEDSALKKALTSLDGEIPLRLMEQDLQTKAFLASLGLVSSKKALVLFNGMEAPADFSGAAGKLGLTVVCFDLLTQGSPGELFSFWQTLLSAAELITFYTTSQSETRAWLLPKGSSALEAAGKVHSDFARGFIKAEVVNFADFQKAGSLAACREKGFLKLEGREYRVVDGDILKIRFAT